MRSRSLVDTENSTRNRAAHEKTNHPQLSALLLRLLARRAAATCSIPSIHTIEVPAFVNKTTRVELEQRVTQSVADEFVSRGRLRLVKTPADADAILRGSIDSFGIFPIAFNQQGRATQYQVAITAHIELVDHRNDDKVLWKNDQYRFTENYQVDLQTADAFDQESRAILEIAGPLRRVARVESPRRVLGFLNVCAAGSPDPPPPGRGGPLENPPHTRHDSEIV